jgi:hypothetical protein
MGLTCWGVDIGVCIRNWLSRYNLVLKLQAWRHSGNKDLTKVRIKTLQADCCIDQDRTSCRAGLSSSSGAIAWSAIHNGPSLFPTLLTRLIPWQRTPTSPPWTYMTNVPCCHPFTITWLALSQDQAAQPTSFIQATRIVVMIVMTHIRPCSIHSWFRHI